MALHVIVRLAVLVALHPVSVHAASLDEVTPSAACNDATCSSWDEDHSILLQVKQTAGLDLDTETDEAAAAAPDNGISAGRPPCRRRRSIARRRRCNLHGRRRSTTTPTSSTSGAPPTPQPTTTPLPATSTVVTTMPPTSSTSSAPPTLQPTTTLPCTPPADPFQVWFAIGTNCSEVCAGICRRCDPQLFADTTFKGDSAYPAGKGAIPAFMNATGGQVPTKFATDSQAWIPAIDFDAPFLYYQWGGAVASTCDAAVPPIVYNMPATNTKRLCPCPP